MCFPQHVGVCVAGFWVIACSAGSRDEKMAAVNSSSNDPKLFQKTPLLKVPLTGSQAFTEWLLLLLFCFFVFVLLTITILFMNCYRQIHVWTLGSTALTGVSALCQCHAVLTTITAESSETLELCLFLLCSEF